MKEHIKDALEDAAKGVAAGKAADIIELTADAFDAISEKYSETISGAAQKYKIHKAGRLERFREKMLSAHPDNVHLWMTENTEAVKTSILSTSVETVYSFFTTEGEVLYTGRRISNRRVKGFFLYDLHGEEIGSIVGHRIKGANPFAVKTDEDIIELELFFRDEFVGIVTNAVWKGPRILSWDTPDWGITQNKVGVHRIVTGNDEVVAEITTRVINSKKLTFLDYKNKEQEKAIVLFFMSLIAYENKLC